MGELWECCSHVLEDKRSGLPSHCVWMRGCGWRAHLWLWWATLVPLLRSLLLRPSLVKLQTQQQRGRLGREADAVDQQGDHPVAGHRPRHGEGAPSQSLHPVGRKFQTHIGLQSQLSPVI